MSLIMMISASVCALDRPAGDINGDFLVDLKDLHEFVNGWLDSSGGPVDIFPGSGINFADFVVLAGNWRVDARPLLITEFLASNGSSLPLGPGEILDSDGDSSDWIELYNPGAAVVDLGGWWLTDSRGELRKWRFPDGLSLGSGQYLIVFASGKNRAILGQELHTNFNLSADGEYLALVDPDSNVIHEYCSYDLSGGERGYPPQERNVSYGFYEGKERYFAVPTPGAANDPIYVDFVEELDVTPGRAICMAPLTVHLSTNTTGATIRYTTDGSEPTATHGTLYTQPIEITTTTTLRAIAVKTGWRPSGIATHTYVFPADVRKQQAPPDYPQSWSGYPADYAMDPEIWTSPTYASAVVPALMAIPTLSIVTDKDNLFSQVYDAETGGIYAYPGHSSTGGRDWERPASVEYFNAAAGEFQIDCGMRIYGGENRDPKKCPKHSFRLLFKAKYGPTKLEFPLFGQGAVDKFDTLLLRGGFNHSWTHWDSTQRTRAQYIRDQWARDTQLAMGRPSAHGVYVHLYLNGLYWGLYSLVERPDTSFASSYFGGEKEEWDGLNSSEPVGESTKTSWTLAQQIANTQDISTPQGYAALAEHVDIDNFIDYMIINLYGGNMDWDDHNWYSAKRRMDGEGFKFFCWDSEHIFENLYGDNIVNINRADKPSRFWAVLKQNPEFRMKFADHVYRHFANDGVLTPAQAAQRWMARARQIDLAIVAESARWGDYRRDVHQYSSGPYEVYTKNDHWIPEQNRLLNTYFPNRTDVVLQFFRSAGLYPSIDPPVFWVNGINLHGGSLAADDAIAMTASSGTIYYTLDGSDPRVAATFGDGWQTTLVAENAPKKVLVPTANIGTAWRGANEPYNESGWIVGTGGVGYETQSGYEQYFSINVMQMLNTHRSCLIRIPFTVDPQQLAEFDFMDLNVRYDDGFVAYLNGIKVYGTPNAPSSPSWNSGASSSHSDAQAVVLERFDISSSLSALLPGNNILAIHGLNYQVSSTDFLISAELVAGRRAGGTSGGTVSPQAITYTQPLRLTHSSRVKARVRSGGEWSALHDAVFTVGPVAQNLRITEIMYNPVGSAPEAEFIELANIGTEAINLNLCRFTNGIDFTFGDLTLAPGERTVVVNNRALFEETYPDFTGSIAGEYIGSLDNMGERITLVDPTGQTIHNFTYLDTWYDITDGGGFSLTIKDPTRGELERIEGGLAGHWKLDEYYGATAADASEAARAGVVRGNPKWRSYGGKINGAIELDGAGSYVEIPDYKGILGGAPRTCAAWIKTSASGVDIVGWGPKGVPYVRWAFTINQSGRLAVEFGGGFVAGTTLVNDDKWHHVAAVLEGPFSDDTRLYVDGRPDPISTLYSLTADTQPGPNVGIGTHLDLRRDFRGLIDNVLIYDRALTADEVALLGASADHWEGKQYWRPSAHMGGSPGQDDTGTVPELGAVVINEILAHSHGSDPDWIELYNTTDEPIDISGWFLSDDNDNYMKFRITAGTVIEPHGYVVFYENQHFNNAQNPGCLKPFALSENGETLYVRSGLDANNNLTGYYEEESFDASETGVAFGRYRKSTGTHNFVAMSYNTPGAPNAYPKVGPIVISEIMYNPPGDAEHEGSDYEFVELCNISDVPVTLQEYDPIRHVMLTWRFTDAIEYTFPLNTTIPPGGFVVVAKNPQAFTARYGPVANVFGPYGGKLANEGEKLEISMPGDTDAQGTRYYIRVDRVNYSDSPEWPQTADGEGDSLTRINLTHYGNDPANWHAAPPTPGQ